ncbi:hypothetical protein KPL71_001175 [Citrus sinensis]|uniref:Uncharacterized protein n=1 Tax=Citrus sinensis TaxID=2711 RepID=A0ACB8NUD8_CITSI|nr:hypothetical protein KPL71_001175 [Citrus sinensis]
MERVMVQTWMFEDFAEEWVFELELVLVSSLVLVEVVDVEETKYGSYQKVQKVHMFGRKKMARRDGRVTQLDSELRAILAQRVYSPDFDKKEAEIRALKAEIARIDSERVQPTMFTSSAPLPVIKPTCHPFLPSFSSRTYEPSKLFGMTHTLFPPHPRPQPKPKKTPKPALVQKPIPQQNPQTSRFEPSPSPSPTSLPESTQPPPIQTTVSLEKQPMYQYSTQQLSHSPSLDSSTENSPSQLDSSSIESSDLSNSDTSNSNLADISKLLMAEPTEQSGATDPGPRTEPVDTDEENQETSETGESSQSMPPQPKVSKPSNGPWFTFDDIPPTKWRERLQELSDWIDLQMLAPDATTQSVLREFSTRFTGSLRDWFDSLGQYRQLKFIQISTVSQALAVLHDQFIAEPSVTFEAARRDYLNMKCFSLNTKDLHYHYKRMSLLYYKLSGFNDPTLRHIFLASLPEELQPEIQRQLAAHRLNIDTLSLGKLFQIALGCLDKLCEQKKLFQELIKDKEPFRSACKKPYLAIKCKDPKKCDCSPKKKSHFKKSRFPFPSRKWCTKLFRFFRKRQSHSKRFPDRKKSSSDFEPIYTVQPSSILIHDRSITIPSVKIQIIPSKYHKPITAIGFIDIGAQRSTHYEHHKLLQQFFQIIQEHGIMISDKKSTIATTSVDFLGMKIQDGHYQPGPHIAQELLHFPNSNFTKKQVQQFLGIINYIRDFLPHVNHHTSKLSALLKKNPPSWSEIHSYAVKQLKQIAQNPPSLKLITDGKRILQTDASDESWGAILLEECNGHFIAYASGQFIDAQKHYHTVYKEILAVKNVPHITYLEQDFQIKTPLKNFLMELNYIPPDQPEILHTSLGPKHEMFMIPTSSLHSQPPNRRLIIKEEKPDYIDFLFQDSQDPYEDFTPVPSPSPYDFPNFPGSSSSQYPPFSSQPEHFP